MLCVTTGISGQVLRTFTDQLVRILQSVSSSCPTPSEVLHHWPTQSVLRAKRYREDSISPTVHFAIPSSPNPRTAGGLCMDISSAVRATTGQYPNTLTQHVFEDRFYWAGFNLHINRPFHIDIKQTKTPVKHLFFLVNQSENQTCSHRQFNCISEKLNVQLFTLLQNISIWLNTQCIIIREISPKKLELTGFRIIPLNSVLFLPTTLLINLIKSVQIRERAIELRWSMMVFSKQEKDKPKEISEEFWNRAEKAAVLWTTNWCMCLAGPGGQTQWMSYSCLNFKKSLLDMTETCENTHWISACCIRPHGQRWVRVPTLTGP